MARPARRLIDRSTHGPLGIRSRRAKTTFDSRRDEASKSPRPLSAAVTAERSAAETALAEVARQLRTATPNVDALVHLSADVASDILDTAVAERSDLIVVGSQGHTAWERFLIGSVSLRVLHYARTAVWLERAPQ